MLPLLTPRLPRKADRRRQTGESLVQLFDRIHKGEQERRSFRDRRATPRVAVALDCEAAEGDARVMCQTADLSTFGVALTGVPTPPLGTHVTLKLLLPDAEDEPVELKGEVLGAFDDKGGARLRFLSPPIDTIKRLHNFLK